MSQALRLTMCIPGPPQPKERARRGKRGVWYTPERTMRYEVAVREVAQIAVYSQHGGEWPTDSEYHVEITAHFPDARARDLDNVCKAAVDACNKVLWRDDRQVTMVTLRRGIDRNDPRTEMTVTAVGMAAKGGG